MERVVKRFILNSHFKESGLIEFLFDLFFAKYSGYWEDSGRNLGLITAGILIL